MSNDKIQDKTLQKWEAYKKLKENEADAKSGKTPIQRGSRKK